VTQLPEIPDEVYRMSERWDYHSNAAHAIEEAWPHLYAAALRHAADLVHDPDAELVLLRLAEEVTP
jgi:hypothetical protein